MSRKIQKTTCDRNELDRMLLEGTADVDYMNLLLGICPEQQKRAESNEKLRLTDEEHDYSFYDDEKEKVDPDYMSILKKLKEHGNAYMIEYEEEDGSRAVIPYEGALCDQEPREKLRKHKDGGPLDLMPRAQTRGVLDSGSQREESPKSLALKGDSSLDRNCDQQYRGKLRSAVKQNDVSPRVRRRRMSTSEEEDVVDLDPVPRRISSQNPKRLRAKSKIEYDEDVIQLDPDYVAFRQNLKLVNNHLVLTAGGIETVYDERSREHMKVEHDDGGVVVDDDDESSSSDVVIIDSATFYKTNTGSDSHRGETGESEFRRKVIAALEKPYDREEYWKLWRDIKLHKPKERHLDLRCGRERQVGTQEDGKSYLDYYPALAKKLRKVKGDWPKRLNLLRGFFLWIKQPEAFRPWLDNECLAVCPRSG